MAKLKKGTYEEETTELLPYRFTPDEKRELGEDMAKYFQESAELTMKMNAEKKKAQGGIDKIDAKVTQIAEKIRSGKEQRQLPCKKVYDYDLSTIQIIRLDTGEVCIERPMTETEKQMKIPLKKGEVAEA